MYMIWNEKKVPIETTKKLQYHKWLILIDSTYKTNRYDWLCNSAIFMDVGIPVHIFL